MSAKVMTSNILAGGLIGIINITVAISVSALMFAGTPPEFFATGVTILLVGTVVCALGGTLASGFPGVIVAPRSGLAPVFAGLVASVAAAMAASGQTAGILPTIVMTIMVTTLFAGLVLVLLGTLRLGGLVRYIPYPVMGGFFAGIGLIFVKGGISVATSRSVSLGNLSDFARTDVLLLALPAVMFAISLYWSQRRWGHWAIFPLLLGLGFAVFYSVFGLTGQTIGTAAAAGWLPIVSATASGVPVFDFTEFALVDWTVVAGQAGSIVTVAILCSIILLLDISGIEIITARELSPDRELKVAGLTNLVNGIASGFPGVHVASDTAFTYKLGGDSRLMGLVYAGAVALAIAAGTGFIGAIPTFILGGLLVYVGIDFLVDWAWRTRRDLPLADYLVILVILGVIASVGILEGVAFGFAIAVVLFVVTYSRLSVIKSEMDGTERASNVDRDPKSREILSREGGRIRIKRLQGFIFFGTSDRLLATVKERIASGRGGTPINYLVLDFRHVSQLDTSAIHAFSKLAQLADKEGIHIVLTEISEAIRNRLGQANFFVGEGAPVCRLPFDNLDEGIAWCEERILTEFDHEDRVSTANLEARLSQLLGSRDAAAGVANYFTPVKVTKGDYLFRQGADGDSLYLVHSAVVAVVILLLDGRQRVVRIFREGAVLGEMAIYTGAPRSASVRIEESGTLFRLDVEQLEAMQRDHPEAAGLFHSFIVRLLAERLDRANRELQRYS